VIPPDAPLCHVFQQNQQHYAYDAGTNNVYKVDTVLADLLDRVGRDSDDAVTARLKKSHHPDDIDRAWRELARSQIEKSRFPDHRPMIVNRGDNDLDWSLYDTSLNHLCLTITERCNLECRYCLHQSSNPWIRPHRNNDMKAETALSAVDYFVRHSKETTTPRVSFYGGEPLLVFDLIRMIVSGTRTIQDWRRLNFSITTNGLLLDEEMIDFIVEHRIALQISLDGPAAVHDRYRQTADGRPTHRRVEEAVTAFLHRHPQAADLLQFAVTLAPPYDLLAVDEYYADFPPYRTCGLDGAPKVIVHMADLAGVELELDDQARDLGAANLTRARKAYIQACAAGRRDDLGPALLHYFDAGLIKYHHRARGPLTDEFHPTGSCLPGVKKLHVKVDGRLQPCESAGESLIIGDVQTGISRSAVRKLYSDLFESVKDRCPRCWAHRLCRLCFTAMAPDWREDDDHVAVVSNEQCRQVRADVDNILKLYVDTLAEGPEALDFLQDSVIS
jgi:uncharacterized protein